MAVIEKVCLYYRDGVSDKVYEIHLTQEEDGFRVTGYNGRRGTKLVAQIKTPRPVPYRTARYIFDNLEASKLNHRRTPYQISKRETATETNNAQPKQESKSNVGLPKPTVLTSEESRTYQAEFLDALEL